MQVNINEGGKKIQLLYVLWVLENFSDENHTLKQDDIVEILKARGYFAERKSIARDLKLLLDFGYKIHGVEPELDEDGNELPLKRGKIWLEREITDEKLSWLMNSIKYNAYMDESQKKEFMQSVASLGSKTFKEKNNAAAMIDGGRIFHVEGSMLFDQLSKIDKAIALGKKIRFTYSKLKSNGNKLVYEEGKEYTVSPYWVIVNKGNTYLVCYNHGENKIWHCRVDKIKHVEIIKSFALPRTETELKGVDVGEYVTKHPLMFSGDAIAVELKVDKNSIGILVESFGANFSVLSDKDDSLEVKVYAGELDIFYWAIQYGGIVEVIKPQSLRDKIRYHIEGMVFSYQRGDGDKYTEAIRTARRNRVLALQGIDLTGKTKHYSLKNVSNIYLSNNNIDNIDFIKNMPRVSSISIENNNVTDLNPLRGFKRLDNVRLVNLPLKNIDALIESPIKYLKLKLDRNVDLSALAKMDKLFRLGISEKCAYNETIPWTELEEKGVTVVVTDRESDDASSEHEVNVRTYLTSYYPYNLLREVFGVSVDIIGEAKAMIADADKVINKFSGIEKEYLELYYKRRIISNIALKRKLGVDSMQYEEMRETIRKKLLHPSFNEILEKYVVESDEKENHALQEVKKRLKEIKMLNKN